MLTKTLAVVLSLNLIMPLVASEAALSEQPPAAEFEAPAALATSASVAEPLPASIAPAPGQAAPLTPEEQAALEARSERPGPEVAGGAWSNQTLTYIVIALAAAVFVLVVK
jgi:hypothetical protein